jgi:hypothetical protein
VLIPFLAIISPLPLEFLIRPVHPGFLVILNQTNIWWLLNPDIPPRRTCTCVQHFYCDNDLVRGSTRCFSVDTCSIFTYFFFIISLIKWSYLSTYLNCWWNLGFLTCAMSLLLIWYKVTRSTMLWTILGSMMNFLIQTVSVITLDTEMYSTSIIKSGIVSCLQLF